MTRIIDLGKYASIPLSELEIACTKRRNKKRKCGKPWVYYVYVLCTIDSLYYVGSTGSLSERLHTHIRKPDGYVKLHPFKSLVYLTKCDTELDMLLLEQRLHRKVALRTFKPDPTFTIPPQIQKWITSWCKQPYNNL